MNLIQTKKLSTNDLTELTMTITGQEALTCEQLFGIEKLYTNWYKKSFRMWLIKKLMRGLAF